MFDKPDDWLRTAGMFSDGNQKIPLLDYDDRGAHWLANQAVIYSKYVSNDQDYGLDLGLWPETFVDYVECCLAKTICEEVTGSDTKKNELEKDALNALRLASNRDAMNEPVTRYPPPGRLVQSRGVSRGRENSR